MSDEHNSQSPHAQVEGDLLEGERIEERFRLLAENANDLVSLHELDGTYLYASPSAERILGYTPEELVGRNPYELVHPEDTEQVQQGSHQDVIDGEQGDFEIMRMRRKDGTYIWVETIGQPIVGENGSVEKLLTSSREVTERVRTEQALAQSNEALQQRNRELQDFAYIASHDLQEPLRKVRAFAGLMLEEYEDDVDEMGRHYLERMHDGAERMSGLIDDLLALSRVTTQGKPFEPVDLEKMAARVRSDLAVRIEETDGRVEIGDLPTIEADATQMRQLLQNLIGNGLKFHRDDVPPVVEVTAAVEQDRTAPAGKRSACRLVVEDNGIGFKEKFADRIFTPFERLHGRSAYEGTGMGLAICRRVVERHHGTIGVETTSGKGSQFIITLPLKQPNGGALNGEGEDG